MFHISGRPFKSPARRVAVTGDTNSKPQSAGPEALVTLINSISIPARCDPCAVPQLQSFVCCSCEICLRIPSLTTASHHTLSQHGCRVCASQRPLSRVSARSRVRPEPVPQPPTMKRLMSQIKKKSSSMASPCVHKQDTDVEPQARHPTAATEMPQLLCRCLRATPPRPLLFANW